MWANQLITEREWAVCYPLMFTVGKQEGKRPLLFIL